MSQAWQSVSEDALFAAGILRREGRYHSSVSRSYYAAFAALTSVLILRSGLTFAEGRDSPPHADLADLAREQLKRRLSPSRLGEVRRGIATLYEARIRADYRPSLRVGSTTCTECLRDARIVVDIMERLVR